MGDEPRCVIPDLCARPRSGRVRSLESYTLDHIPYTGPGYQLVARDFGENGVQVVGVRIDESGAFGRGKGRKGRGDAPKVRLARSVARSRVQMRRRMRALGADNLLTLTKRGRFDTLDDAWAAWRVFSRLMARFYGAKWAYVVVAEGHQAGGFHLHAAVKGFFWAGVVRRLWYRALGGTGRETGSDTPGNIDFRAVRGRLSYRKIAYYLGKYMSKGFAVCPGGGVSSGRRFFAASVGLDPVRIARWRVPFFLGCSTSYELLRRLFDGRGTVREWEYGGVVGFTIEAPPGAGGSILWD